MQRRKNKRGSVALKFDEWSFLRNTLLKYDFPLEWIQLIIQCVSTILYQVIYNGYNTPVIQPQRGLRQGKVTHYHHIYTFSIWRS